MITQFEYWNRISNLREWIKCCKRDDNFQMKKKSVPGMGLPEIEVFV